MNMKLLILWSTLLFTSFICLAKCDMFTSLAHLESALYAEKDIASILHLHINNERQRLDKLEKIVDKYSQHFEKAMQNTEHTLGNPIDAFLLIKRFTVDYERDVSPILGNDSWKNLNVELQYARRDLPSFEDLTGAAIALARLQDTYHLEPSKIARGDLGGIMSTVLSGDDCFELGRALYYEHDYYHTALWMEQSLSLLNSASLLTRHVELLDYISFAHYKFISNDCRTVEDCYLLGRLCYNEKDMYHTILWMQQALDLSRQLSAASRSIPTVDILYYLSYSVAVHGNVKHALNLTNELLRLDPSHQRASNNKRYFESMIEQQGGGIEDALESPAIIHRDTSSYQVSDEHQIYEALCRGENVQEIKDAHRLKCRYVHNNHPLLLLQPVKEEEVHLDPWIVVYRDILSDSEINDLKVLARPKLNRATVQNSKTGKLETANYRISKSAWLKNSEHPTVERFTKRMEALTGLNMDTAEELQIANYGLGGHYEPHFDFARKEEKDAFKSLGTGNRIATVLSYISDVEAGGATVFPYIGLKLYPKKGTAAFWYNLHRNGDGVYNTRHAACPVLVGVKWVANKWVHERGQEFRRPCTTVDE